MISADKAIQLLKEGNERFYNNLKRNRNHVHEIEATKEKQEPFAVVISCMDSRTSPEIIFDKGIGDIFSIRIAGNVITPEVIGSAEYACAAVKTKVILVLGHTGCGAVKGSIDNVQLGQLSTITQRIRSCMHEHSTIEEVTTRNVEMGIGTLMAESKVLNELVINKEIKIIGGIYDITTGQVWFMDNSLSDPDFTSGELCLNNSVG